MNTPERWRRIEDLYHAASERAESEREGFLAAACGEDAAMRAEVESLLRVAGEEGDFLEGSPLGVAAESVVTLKPGDTLGAFQIVASIRRGGMGQVWKARDPRLGRNVAIKISARQFSHRFEREARSIAALNHPNICTLHDVGPNYLVMELVEGPTLAERIAQGPIPLQEALGLARQIADALEAAHEKGIIHRDLKPANVKIRPDGSVKVLDFGLAKVSGAGEMTSNSPTALPGTQSGLILGTAGYMSPEQARGQTVDKRADIWAFGVVIYEMLTGKRLFDGATVTDSLAAIIKMEPDLTATPDQTRRLLQRCLDKDPKKRLRDIGDWQELLPEPLQTKRGKPSVPWIAATMVLACIAAIFSVLYLRKPPADTVVPLRFQLQPPQNTTGPNIAVSPDGRKVAFMAAGRLWVHFLESGEWRDITETDHAPFWSPDSRFLAYGSKGKLRKIEALGGPSQRLADIEEIWGNGAWSQDGVIIFAQRQVGIFRVSASGGVPVQITALDRSRHENAEFSPRFLPDGRHFVYPRASIDEGMSALFLGSVDAGPEQQSRKPLTVANSQAIYAPSSDPRNGYLIYVRAGNLMAQPFDNRRLEFTGPAAPVAERVSNSGDSASYVAFSASLDGVLAFPVRSPSTATWYDREGRLLGPVGEPGSTLEYQDFRISPEGTRLLLARGRGADRTNLWMLDLSRGGAAVRFTFGMTRDSNPVWSPDGSRVVYSSNADGTLDLYQRPANGGTDAEVVLKSGENKYATSWSPDGRYLLYYTSGNPKSKRDIWVLPMQGEAKPFPFLVTEFNERQATFSPDGRWVAYTSDEAGEEQVYVRSFALSRSGAAVGLGGKWPISDGYGTNPRWRRDGREIYYRSRRGGVVAVEVATSPAFRAATPRALGILTFATDDYDSTADGKRFVGMATSSGAQSYTVVLNWKAKLNKSLVP